MPQNHLTDGLIIIVLGMRDRKAREQVVHRLCEIGDQVMPTVNELNTSDWDPGLRQEEVDYFELLLEGTSDGLLIWRFAGQTYTRFTIRGTA